MFLSRQGSSPTAWQIVWVFTMPFPRGGCFGCAMGIKTKWRHEFPWISWSITSFFAVLHENMCAVEVLSNLNVFLVDHNLFPFVADASFHMIWFHDQTLEPIWVIHSLGSGHSPAIPLHHNASTCRNREYAEGSIMRKASYAFLAGCLRSSHIFPGLGWNLNVHVK